MAREAVEAVAVFLDGLGLERSTAEILARGRPGQVQAIVRLGNRMADQAVGDRAIAAARRAEGAGVIVYVVGMGPSMDERVLRGLASGSTTWFPAPNPLSIRRIYQDLTRRVSCPPGAHWGRR